MNPAGVRSGAVTRQTVLACLSRDDKPRATIGPIPSLVMILQSSVGLNLLTCEPDGVKQTLKQGLMGKEYCGEGRVDFHKGRDRFGIILPVNADV